MTLRHTGPARRPRTRRALAITLAVAAALFSAAARPAWADDAGARDAGTGAFYAVYSEVAGMVHGQSSPGTDDASHITFMQDHQLFFVYSPGGVPRFEGTDSSTWEDAPQCWKVPSSIASADEVPWKEVLAPGGVRSVKFGVSVPGERMAPLGMRDWFAGATDLTALYDANRLDTSRVTDFSETFAGVATGTIHVEKGGEPQDIPARLALDLSVWDTSAATSMDRMFAGATGLTSVTMGGSFSSASLTSASEMFAGCTSLSGTLALPSAFTLDKATALDGLFSGCTGLTGVSFPAGFTAGSATTIEGLFSGCSSLERVDLASLAPASCTNADDVFAGVEGLREIALGVGSSLSGAGETRVALPEAPARWRFASRVAPEGEAEGTTLTYPVGSVLGASELAALWDSDATAGTWVAHEATDDDIVVDLDVYDGTGETLALTEWAGTSMHQREIDLSDGRDFPHARGVHQTGWTEDGAPTVIEPGMAHVEPTYALGAHVAPQESMTLFATYDANDFTVAEPAPVTFDGTDHTPTLALTAWDGTAVAAGEVDVAWTDAAGKPAGELVAPGTYTATVTPHADGNFAYALPKTVHLTVQKMGNEWLEGPSIDSWSEGERSAAPVARAAHGATLFSYRKAGSADAWSAEQPTREGSYVMRATVEATDTYDGLEAEVPFTIAPMNTVPMYRLYNPYSGEHFYTESAYERDALAALGWATEGVGWSAPVAGEPVYRLYNPCAGDHHYTLSAFERDCLVAAGWQSEGVGWHSADATGTPVLREYNPYAATGTHNFTTSEFEHRSLVGLGWHDEGIAWYAA